MSGTLGDRAVWEGVLDEYAATLVAWEAAVQADELDPEDELPVFAPPADLPPLPRQLYPRATELLAETLRVEEGAAHRLGGLADEMTAITRRSRPVRAVRSSALDRRL